MSWDDVNDILYDGTEKQIAALSCPDCGGSIQYHYDGTVRSFEIKCSHCGYLSRGHGGPKPNCAQYFGEEGTLPRS